MEPLKHILIIEDEADLVELIAYNLRKEGFSVDSSPDGEAALGKIRKGNYNLLILDLMLPGIQGMELCRIIRNDPKTAETPDNHAHGKGRRNRPDTRPGDGRR